MNKIRCMILAAAISMTCILPVSAAQTQFKDVSVNTPAYEAIMNLTEKGVINGIGGGFFAPDKKVSFTEFLAMYMKAQGKDLISTGVDWKTDVETTAMEEQLASLWELNNCQGSCSWITILNRVFRSVDAWSPEVWGETRPTNMNLTIPEGNMIVSAKNYGFLNGLDIQDYNTVPTRAEVAMFLYNLEQSDMTGPAITNEFPVTLDRINADMDKSLLYEAIQNLPEKYRNHFLENGWTLTATTAMLSELRPDYKNYGHATGICDASSKDIIVRAPFLLYGNETVYHEFGHYVSYAFNTKIPASTFQEEKSALKEFLGDYAATSADEAFADAFAYYVSHQNDAEAMAAFRTAAPKTAAIMDQLF